MKVLVPFLLNVLAFMSAYTRAVFTGKPATQRPLPAQGTCALAPL